MDKAQIKGLLKEVVENNKRLNQCPGPHDFQLEPGEESVPTLRKYYRCTKCQGKVDTLALSWYTKGIDHGRLPC